MTAMATELKLNGTELLEVDICDGGMGSGDESGVYVNSAASLQDDFSGFQQWTSPAESPSDTSSSSPGRQEAPGGHGAPPGTAAATQRTDAAGDSDSESLGNGLRTPRTSIVDCLLVELYETYSGGSRRHADSWDSSTEASGSDAFLGRSNSGSSFLQELQERHTRRHQMNYLAQKAPEELRSIIQEVKYRTGLQSAKLIRQLKRRDRLFHKLQKNYDIVTACLQAVSQKRRKTLQNLILTGLPTCPSVLPHPSILAPPPGDAKPEEDEEVQHQQHRHPAFLLQRPAAVLDRRTDASSASPLHTGQ